MARVHLSSYIGLPDEPHDHLEHGPLVLVVCQVRFSSVLRIGDESYVAGFQDAIRGRFPITSRQQSLDLQFGVGAQTLQATPQQQVQWQFTDTADVWKVVLASDYVAVETRGYDSFEDFLARLGDVLKALKEEIGPEVITRVGLRYVNEIRGAGLDWQQAVEPYLLGPLEHQPLVGNASRMQQMARLQLTFPEGGGVAVGYGLVPDGTTVIPRANDTPPTGEFFLLDYDVYRLPTQPVPFVLDEILSDVRDFNSLAYRLFAWTTTKQYRDLLRAPGGLR